jgi:hypothetical protein
MAGGPFGRHFGGALPLLRYAYLPGKYQLIPFPLEKKERRKLELTDTCIICGLKCETTFHTFCRCPLAQNLWQSMAEIWPLPDLMEMKNTDNEWLLHLLYRKSETVGS